jgi:hypothetical protein
MFSVTKRYAAAAQLGLAVLLGVGVSMAQTFRGGINGTVTDPSGAVTPGAKVTATNEATGVSQTFTATKSGAFTFSDMPLGQYTLTVVADGFRTEKVQHVPVLQGTVYTSQVHLNMAGSTAEVNVSANALTLDTTSATQTTVITAQAVDAVPLNGRDFTQLVAVTPGFAGYSIGGGGTGMGALNGTRYDQMNWQIDGIDNNDLYANVPAVNQGGILGIPGVVMPMDAVDQFSVQTQGNAEAGRNPGGVVNLGLKSGGNMIHGSAYLFERNEAFSKANPFLATGDTKKRNRNYNAGASLGGPIIKDKLFFFGALETQTFSIGQNGGATEPSAAFQAQAKALLTANNVAVNGVAQNLLNTLWPAYALTGPAPSSNYTSTTPQYGHSWNGLVKLDYALNQKNNLSLHWFAGEGNQVAPNGSQLAPYYEVGPIHVSNYSAVLNTMVTPRISNQLLAGVNYFNQFFNNADQNFDVLDTGLVTGSRFPNQAPKIRISGFDNVSVVAPSGRNDITGHLTDTMSYSVGKHDFRFGGEYRRGYVNIFNSGNSTGQFNFTGTQGPWATNTAVSSSVRALADFLSGKVATSSFATGNPERWVYVNTFDLFAQDTYRVTNNLTLNYGVRFDYEGAMHDNANDLSVFVPGKGLLFQGTDIAKVYPSDWNNFGPRFGFSYTPSISTGMVIRGGIGLYYDQPILAAFLNNSTSNSSPIGLQANPAGSSPFFSLSKSAYTLTAGQQIFPTGAARTCTVTSTCGIFPVDQNVRTPYTMNFNLNVEQQLGSKVVAQLGYVGNESRKLLGVRDINQSALASTGSPSTAAQVLAQQTSRPYYSLYPTYGNINQLGTFYTGNYSSLQATVKVASLHGFSGQMAYTWAHAFDENSNSRSQLPQDSTNLKADYGNSALDVRHTFVGYVNYSLPNFTRGPKLLVQGWQVNSLVSLHGGVPFNVFNSSDTSGTDEGAQRVNLIGNPYAGVSHSFDYTNKTMTWVNPAAFASPANGKQGTMERNQLYGPGFADVDVSFFKTTPITERIGFQLRVEAFNVFNRANFAAPNNTFGASGFGTLYDTIGDASGAPGIGPGEPLNLQLGGKLVF